MAFRGLTADRTPLEEYRFRFSGIHGKHSPASDNYIPLHAFTWLDGAPSGAEISHLKSVKELASQAEGAARIVSVFKIFVKLRLILIALLQEMMVQLQVS